MTEKETRQPKELELAKLVAQVLDEAFTIPGTSIKFGIDPILGLLPLAGDAASFLISGLVIIAAIRNGVSFSVLLKMLGNLLFDFLFGSIPVIGTFFDFGYKANRKNLDLLKKFYASGKPTRPAPLMAAWLVLLFVGILILVAIGTVSLMLLALKSLG